jgi:hypothetical protein
MNITNFCLERKMKQGKLEQLEIKRVHRENFVDCLLPASWRWPLADWFLSCYSGQRHCSLWWRCSSCQSTTSVLYQQVRLRQLFVITDKKKHHKWWFCSISRLIDPATFVWCLHAPDNIRIYMWLAVKTYQCKHTDKMRIWVGVINNANH